jgi:hypothetical protein
MRVLAPAWRTSAPAAKGAIQPVRWMSDFLAFSLLTSRFGPGLQSGMDVTIGPSPGRGSGAFAARHIAEGEFVGRYTGAIYSNREYKGLCDRGLVSGAYAFGAGGDWLIDAEDEHDSGWLRYVNHSRRRTNLAAGVGYMWFGPCGIIFMFATAEI